GDILVVMDADLSHPPEAVPRLALAIEEGADLAVGSRYVAGGGTEDWPLRRRVVSRAACLLGNVLVPIRDCTSGFFAIRRSALYKKAVEIPYVFRDRELGKSKFGRREVMQYLVQLGQVARDKVLRRAP